MLQSEHGKKAPAGAILQKCNEHYTYTDRHKCAPYNHTYTPQPSM